MRYVQIAFPPILWFWIAVGQVHQLTVDLKISLALADPTYLAQAIGSSMSQISQLHRLLEQVPPDLALARTLIMASTVGRL